MVLQNCKSVTLNTEEEEDAPLLPVVVIVVVVAVVVGVDTEEVNISDSDFLDIMDDFNSTPPPPPPPPPPPFTVEEDVADDDDVDWEEESWSISSKLDIMGFTYNNYIAAITSDMWNIWESFDSAWVGIHHRRRNRHRQRRR